MDTFIIFYLFVFESCHVYKHLSLLLLVLRHCEHWFLFLDWWLLLLLETLIYYPCFRVYVAQIHVDLSSRFCEFCLNRTDDLGTDSPALWPTELVLHRLGWFEYCKWCCNCCAYIFDVYCIFTHAHLQAYISTHVRLAHKSSGKKQAQEPDWKERRQAFC